MVRYQCRPYIQSAFVKFCVSILLSRFCSLDIIQCAHTSVIKLDKGKRLLLKYSNSI